MILSLTAYAVIPIYTILFVSGTNWLTSNLSVIGNWPDRQVSFFLLGLIIGLYYHCILKRLLSHLPHHLWESVLLHTALILLFLAISTPYLPAQVPLQSFLHVLFSRKGKLIFPPFLFTLHSLFRISCILTVFCKSLQIQKLLS